MLKAFDDIYGISSGGIELMTRKQRIRLYISLAVGICADGYLRISSGDEGNLLVHSVVFLVSAGVAYAIMKVCSWFFNDTRKAGK